MSSFLKNIIAVLAIVLLVYLGFWYITRQPDTSQVASVSVTSGNSTSSNPADEFASLLDQLSSVDFQQGAGQVAIFDNPIFKDGLVSFRRDLPSIDRSRVNPFAPLEGNPSIYTHYTSPLPASLTPTVFPTSTSATGTKATTTKKK